ncbi:MAG: Na+/H+ antiporter subunit E [Spirochaetales bacterium]|nr:Na+/H+ antiporter subunit E [Spirochaetales bacterium]
MRILKWTAALFVMWIAMTLSLDTEELIAGLALSLMMAVISTKYFAPRSRGMINPFKALKYLAVLMVNLYKSNVDIARRVLDPKLPINPGIVKISTKLESPFRKLILANSITLTPGTVTLDVDGQDLYVHWIDVVTDDPEKAGELIKGDFERVLS